MPQVIRTILGLTLESGLVIALVVVAVVDHSVSGHHQVGSLHHLQLQHHLQMQMLPWWHCSMAWRACWIADVRETFADDGSELAQRSVLKVSMSLSLVSGTHRPTGFSPVLAFGSLSLPAVILPDTFPWGAFCIRMHPYASVDLVIWLAETVKRAQACWARLEKSRGSRQQSYSQEHYSVA